MEMMEEKMETKITTLLGKEEVADRIKEMAEDINRDYAGTFNLYIERKCIFYY